MKKLLLVIAAASAFTGNAYACQLSTIDTPQIREVVSQHGGWPISDEKCAILNKHNLALFVSGQATVLSNVSVGWAEVKLARPGLNIVSDKSQLSTTVNSSKASMVTAGDAMYESIGDAIAGLDFVLAAAEVKEYQAKASRQAPPAAGKR